MGKLIEIEIQCCSACPINKPRVKSGNVETYCEKTNSTIDCGFGEFPTWCPLKDAVKKEQSKTKVTRGSFRDMLNDCN